LAAVDLGSNAARLLVASVFKDALGKKDWKALEYVRVPLRLGEDVFLTGKIGAVRRQQLLDTMQGFSKLMAAFSVDHSMACATSAMREAGNGAELLALIQQHAGLALEVISGVREAELIYKAHRYLAGPNDRLMLMDVGGGSTEISLIQGQELVACHSIALGAVRLLDQTDREEDWKGLKDFVKNQVRSFQPTVFYGSGGNINKVFELMKAKKGVPCTYKSLDKLHKQLESYPTPQRMLTYGLNEDRADVIVPATRLFLWVMRQAEISKLYNSKLGLKEGLIMDLIEKHAGDAPSYWAGWGPGPLSDTTHLSTAE